MREENPENVWPIFHSFLLNFLQREECGSADWLGAFAATVSLDFLVLLVRLFIMSQNSLKFNLSFPV